MFQVRDRVIYSPTIKTKIMSVCGCEKKIEKDGKIYLCSECNGTGDRYVEIEEKIKPITGIITQVSLFDDHIYYNMTEDFTDKDYFDVEPKWLVKV